MGQSKLASVVKDVQRAMKKHSPEILTGIGVAGMITTTVMAVRATPRAVDLIEGLKRKQWTDMTREQADELRETGTTTLTPVTPVDIVRAAWKCYIPAAITGAASVACLIGASSANVRRNAALATAYTLSESALKEYQDKIVETIGEKREKEVRDSIAKDKLDRAHIEDRNVIVTGNGETPSYDPLTDRFFKSDIETLRRAENKLNKQMRDEMCVMLNEFYSEIGLDECELGERLGWDIDKGYIDLDFSSQLDKNGIPCLVLGHHNPPRYIE